MINKKTGNKIRSLREAKKITREDFADRLSMTASGYGKIERGETDIPLSRIEQICRELKVDLVQLLNFNESNPIIDNTSKSIDNYKEKYIIALERENERLRKLCGEE
jgi:transcriptional regulator with XRE-family HTH domain